MPSGAAWEARAERYLVRAGLRTIDRNYRCRLGEIDLVMEDGEVVVFVEVRFRKAATHGTGAESVGPEKQVRLVRAARHFLAGSPRYADRPCRFDVMSLSGRWPTHYEWITDAIQVEN